MKHIIFTTLLILYMLLVAIPPTKAAIYFDSLDGKTHMIPDEVLGSGTGDITSVLGDSSDDVPVLYQTWSAFTAADATPDVSTATFWRTVDTTTITGFDGSPVDGQMLVVYCGAATVFDLTSSEISASNRTTDYTATVGDILIFFYRTDQWWAVNIPDATAEITSNGYIARTGSGTAAARTFQDTSTIGWANADGVSGNTSAAIVDASVIPSKVSTAMKTDSVTIIIGNGSDAITTGTRWNTYFIVPYKHDIGTIALTTTENAGSITIDIWADELTGGTDGPDSDITDADSFFDTASEPAIADASSDAYVTATVDSGEGTDVPAGTGYVVTVDAASTLTRCILTISFTRKD